MSAPDESIAVMTDPASTDDEPPAGPPAPGKSAPEAAPASTASSGPVAAAAHDVVSEAAVDAGLPPVSGVAAATRPGVSNALITVFGGLVAALLGAQAVFMVWQMGVLSDRIDNLSDKIDDVRTELSAEFRAEIGALREEFRAELHSEIGSLRAEMREGFREVHAILRDHTDRLARLETAAGLPRPAPVE